jgi:dephospho-CoA kinase
MFGGKPVIGVAGGIGSGKSFVAALFGEEGCLVISADDQVRLAYKDFRVKQAIKQWWGNLVFSPNGDVDRSAVARKVFSRADELRRLEQLLHPIVNQARENMMKMKMNDPQVLAFVWDTPLLFENGLEKQCDAVVFVETPLEQRQERLKQSRGWEAAELESRENLQLPLDKKKEISDYVISNTAGMDQVRAQVRDVLSRILAAVTHSTGS